MVDYEVLLEKLISAPRIRRSSVDAASKLPGAYVLWLDTEPLVCLKVGIAGLRKGKGVRDRLMLHFRNDPRNTILARHLIADDTSAWTKNRDFTRQDERSRLLAEHCFFQVLPLPSLTPTDLKSFEAFIQARLEPRYAHRVRP
jgi:hypothetical protein